MKRNFQIILTATAEEKNKIKENAEKNGYSVSTYLRKLGLSNLMTKQELFLIIDKNMKGKNTNAK